MLNLFGQVVPTAAAVIGIPILIRHLGAPRFGVLTLTWAAIGYFGLFDLGLGRALTQAIAVRLGADDERADLPAVAWTALLLMLVLGAIGGLLVAIASPWIVSSGLNIPPDLQRETLVSFYLLACSLPFVVTSAGLRGLLEAHQHFGVVAVLRVPLSLFTFIAPLAVLPFSTRLVPVVAVLAVGRLLTFGAFLVVCVRRYAYLRHGMQVRRRVVMPLLRFGGWMTVSNVVSPLMAYVDRFFIGAILPLAAVAYYVTPLEIVSKLLVLPLALISALFPAFAATYVADRKRTATLYEQALRALALALFPLFLVIALFAREGLTLWVGAQVARESAPVLRWLAIGCFVNCIGQAPFAVLQGAGRPDLTAKLHMVEVPLYAAALWIFAHRYGVVGVAMAWTLRVSVDTGLLLVLGRRQLAGAGLRVASSLVILVGALALLAIATALHDPAAKLGYLVAVLVVFLFLGWTRGLTTGERSALRAWLVARRAGHAPVEWTPEQNT